VRQGALHRWRLLAKQSAAGGIGGKHPPFLIDDLPGLRQRLDRRADDVEAARLAQPRQPEADGGACKHERHRQAQPQSFRRP
jgi:hypothetical protein